MEDIAKKDLKIFGLIMSVFIAAVFGLVFPFVFNLKMSFYPWVISAFFILSSLLFPYILKPVYQIWTAFGKVIGWINTKIILTIIYFLVFVPTGLIMKMVGYDSMHRKLNSTQDSYRIDIEKNKQSNPLKDPF